MVLAEEVVLGSGGAVAAGWRGRFVVVVVVVVLVVVEGIDDATDYCPL